jgi:hypothetical protein
VIVSGALSFSDPDGVEMRLECGIGIGNELLTDSGRDEVELD